MTPTGTMYGYFVQDDIHSPTFVAIEGGGFIASYPDGTVGGPSSEFDQMSLPQAQYLGDNEWIGIGANGMLTAMAGPDFQKAGTWSARGGGEQNSNGVWDNHAGIFVKGHHALWEPLTWVRHASLRLVPHEDTEDWSERVFLLDKNSGLHGKPFTNVDGNGYRFATIGAGPEGGDYGTCEGRLIGDVNRPTDVELSPLELHKLDISPFLENKIIVRLLALNSNYVDDLPYGCTVIGADHNSNGYVAGLLDAGGIDRRKLFGFNLHLYPGWTNPVTKVKFQ